MTRISGKKKIRLRAATGKEAFSRSWTEQEESKLPFMEGRPTQRKSSENVPKNQQPSCPAQCYMADLSQRRSLGGAVCNGRYSHERQFEKMRKTVIKRLLIF